MLASASVLLHLLAGIKLLQADRRRNGGRRVPAMEAGLSDRIWSIEEIVGLLGRSRTKAP